MKAAYFKNPTKELKKMGFTRRRDGVFVRDQGRWQEWVRPEPAIQDGTQRCQINVGVAPEAQDSPNTP